MKSNRGLIEAQSANKSFSKAGLEQYSEVQRWIESKKESTKHVYLQALISFTDYTKLNPKELIDLAEEDQKKSQRERGEPARISGQFPADRQTGRANFGQVLLDFDRAIPDALHMK